MRKYIRNIKDAKLNSDGSASTCVENNSICADCGKKMKLCWDTVCCYCGDTLCYDHSYIYKKNWYCKKCLEKIFNEKQEKIKRRIRQ